MKKERVPLKKFLILLLSSILTFIAALLIFPALLQGAGSIYLNSRVTTKFEVKGNEVSMNGDINSKTYDQFVELLERNPQVDTLVEEIVPGSVDDETMIKLAYFVREKGLNTKLLSYSEIDSGGVDLFLAGVERTMEDGAHIGVHSWSGGFKEAKDYPEDAPEHEANRKYVEDMLGKDDFYWFTIYAASAKDIHEMTQEEIEKYELLTKPVMGATDK
ncbi:MAG: hypothetical protein K8R40_13835 [Anaerolineaceae bacterium]|nr:hypothetical protein [Anaerolineaceae bacterium]